MPTRQFEVQIGDQEFQLEFSREGVRINGTPVEFEVVSGRNNYRSLIVNNRSYSIVVEPITNARLRIIVNGVPQTVQVKDPDELLLEQFGLQEALSAAETRIRAPMPGLVLSITVTEGETVKSEQGLLILEAMKMENEIRAPAPARIEHIHTSEGATVDKDELLIELAPVE